jgi:DNA-binding NarL/FixJ family response regulator
MERIHILIADDHPLFRDGLRALVQSFPELEWVGEAKDGIEVVKKATDLQPDVILMDIHMPGLNGIEATRSILSHSPHIGILMITMYDDDDFVFAAMRAGARGYLLKGADQEEIMRAIIAVGSGQAIFSPAIARRMMAYFSSVKAAVPADLFPELTERELEILNLIAHGCNNLEIAEKLFLSHKTVRNHVSNIFSKLQVVDRAHAIIRAREAGMGF